MIARRTFLQHSAAAMAWAASGVSSRGVHAAGEDSSARQLRMSRARFGSLSYSFGIRARSEAGFGEPLRFAQFCREQGFGGIQVGLRHRPSDECRALRAELEGIEMYVEGIVGLPKDKSDCERFEAELRSAKECGAEVLRAVMLSGRRYEVFASADEFREFRARSWNALQLAEPLVRRHGLKLAVENHKDYRADEFAEILRRISSELLGVCLDTGNNIALLDDPWQTVELLAPWTFTVHLKDMAVEESADGFLLAEVPLGSGLLDLGRIMERVSAANPRARFNLEMITRDPLRIPCLSDRYWATLSHVSGEVLARTLRMVKQHARPAGSLPRITARSPSEQIALEQQHVEQSVQFARQAWGLA